MLMFRFINSLLSVRFRILLMDFAKYGVASVGALGADLGVLSLLFRIFHFNYQVASAIGFACGLAVIYSISIYYVFRGRRTVQPLKEFAIFSAVGLAGLLINQALLMGLVEVALLPVEIAKIITAGLVFMFNFVARRASLFKVDVPDGRKTSPQAPEVALHSPTTG
jgi:putative flippase GtrA